MTTTTLIKHFIEACSQFQSLVHFQHYRKHSGTLADTVLEKKLRGFLFVWFWFLETVFLCVTALAVLELAL